MKNIKYFIFAILLSLFFINNAKAEVISLSDTFGITYNGTSTFPVGYWTNSARHSLYLYNYEGLTRPYTYLVYSICTNASPEIYITNSGYTNYFAEESVVIYYSGNSCSYGGYAGSIFYVQLQVGKYADLDGTGEELVASSYLNYSYTLSWTPYLEIRNFYLSSDDVISQFSQNSKLLSAFNTLDASISSTNSKIDTINSNLNNVNSSINNVQSSINETNDKLEETKSALTGESDDTTSKSCGVICKLKGIFTGIVELPGKLVNLLIDALKILFVPTDEQLFEIIQDSSNLAENFGFVGQSIDFFLDIFTTLLGLVNDNGCAILPEFTIGKTSLFDSFTFWEEQQVCLADNVILNDNISTIRTITSIVLVSLFLGFATSKFFGILSKNGEEDVVDYSDRESAVPTVTHYRRVNGTTYKE